MKSLHILLKFVSILGIIAIGCIGIMLVFEIGNQEELRETLIKTVKLLGILIAVSAGVMLILGSKK